MHPLPPEFLTRAIHVALVGCGGNGSQMLTGLARLDVTLRALGHPEGLSVFVYDPDVVSETNVGRQLFSPADVGQPKAHVLVHRVNAFYGLHWTGDARAFPNYDVPLDFLISCVDSAKARRELHEFTLHRRVSYWLDLGNEARTGQVILGQPPSTRALRQDPWRLRTVTEIFPEILDQNRPEDPSPSCSLAQALDRQDLFVNQAVVTPALHLLWTLLRRGELAQHGYFVNLEAGTMVPLKIVEHAAERANVRQGPRRRIVKLLQKRKNLFEANKVRLSCGHVTRSNAQHKAHCPKCKENHQGTKTPRKQ